MFGFHRKQTILIEIYVRLEFC